ncbi:leucyl/phenylalanyl-tRNA--protein transferase [Swaminathania salitolerans]|uniref:Leucyl/phenylalanyl-tRNA--protein transferase n=1 Tax=Swaminathania salitolerans TaxID=182838 RepID=A0A511BNA3_9PROT|nr:leucyl/phenylalanyl-tRNA--protein transferase [Swaminathania salitolerans]GBQ10559.1 leucyl/phenylalanyl-tRNA--protein transferase [Swaminathania salitolerans LMG 21291]GEL01333.1 leucyl/phenylalanyl-tRNA--protein transferase [Swaminathania salitolerans]
MIDPLTSERLIEAYRMGVFPMSDGRSAGDITWHRPLMRGILPLGAGFHLSKRLARTVLQGRFSVTSDRAFNAVIRSCAEVSGRDETWISHRLEARYGALHALGHAHSIEIWSGSELVGGLYGVHLGGAFFGESMFSRRTDASKIALVHLVATLRRRGFVLLDTQFPTTHLERFGCQTVPDTLYRLMLDRALTIEATWSHAVALDELRQEIAVLREESASSQVQ